MRVEARLQCKSCGTHLNLTLKGDPTRLSEKVIGARVLRVAEARHDCPAVQDEMTAHLDKYFSDLRRGMEKKREADYLREKGSNGKSA